MLGRTNTGGGGGGGGLNYKVVGGTSAPSNPKENTIWVNTSTEITSHVFSATQPTGSEGMVWFKTETICNVNFNALKKNVLQVYPLSAKQYVSGAWVDKTAKIYQGGAWKEFVRLPVLNSSYPENVTLSDNNTTSATFKVQIATAGVPASYTYQWYVNGTAVSGATSATYTRSNLVKPETLSVYCKVTNEAGTVQSRTATLKVTHMLLYIKGNECSANTGGWESGTFNSSGYSLGTATKNSASMTFSVPSSYKSSGFGTKNKIALTNYTKLKINITALDFKVFFTVDDNKNWNDDYRAADLSIDSKTGVQTIDISSISGSYYVYIMGFTTGSNTGTCTFNKVWLE